MTTFADFVAAFHDHMTDDPNACLALGVDRHGGDLPDPGSVDRVAGAQRLLSALADVEHDGLGFDEHLDLDLARLAVQRRLVDETLTFNGRTMRQQCPRVGDDVGAGLHLLVVRDPRPAGERLRDATSRLEGVPAHCEAALRRLDRPVARWVDIDAETVAGLPALFETLVAWSERTAFGDHARLLRARAAAEASLADYRERLLSLPTTRRFAIGDAAARQAVALRGIDLSLEELHRIATGFLARNGERIEHLRRTLVAKHDLPEDTRAADLQRHLARMHRVHLPAGSLDGVLARYEDERRRILAFIAERELFPVPGDQDMVVLRTPPFLEPMIPAGAMWEPAPFREGTAVSLVYLTLRENLLDEHTELSIPGMMIHEGIPGHHLQLAAAARHPSVVRRHLHANDLHEGWTTMLEDYMLDVGYGGELEDEMRFVGQRDIARIGARVAIDLFFMTGEKDWLDVGVPCDLSSDDPFEAAGELLAEVTGFVPARVQAELNWKSLERGYPLSYLAGNRLMWRLKDDVARAQAGRLDGLALDRAFHRTVLQAGNMPLSFLRRVFEHEGLLEAPARRDGRDDRSAGARSPHEASP